MPSTSRLLSDEVIRRTAARTGHSAGAVRLILGVAVSEEKVVRDREKEAEARANPTPPDSGPGTPLDVEIKEVKQ